MKYKFLVSILFLVSLLVPAQLLAQKNKKFKKPINVILLIGDGMGTSQMSSAFYYGNGTNSFEEFPFTGFSNTSSATHKITDSAAGGTALASGTRTYNGAIGLNTDSLPLQNIVEFVSQYGLSTGVVATSSITHATPASFYAHTKWRNMEEDIAKDLVKSEIDFFAGGGIKFFNQRKDGLKYLDSLKMHGFEVDTTSLPLQFKSDPAKKYGFLLASKELSKTASLRNNFLANATQMAIDHLSKNKNGFFLMVEGSQIDWGGHANDAEYLINEVLDFDKALKVALDFAKKNKNTLVIVTADHETGGFTLAAGKESYEDEDTYNNISPTFATGGHSATLVPVLAFGKGASKFVGFQKNTDIFDKMKETFVKGE